MSRNTLNFSMDFANGVVTLKRDLLTEQAKLLFESGESNTTISLKNFFALLKSALANSYASPDLPYGTVLYEETSNYLIVVVEIREFPFTFRHSTFARNEGLKMIFPKSYFICIVPMQKMIDNPDKLNLAKTFIFVEDNFLGNTFDKNKKYYRSPFSNYSPTFPSGVCWGSGSDPIYRWAGDFGKLSNLEQIARKYVASEFNMDLSPSVSTSDFRTEYSNFMNGKPDLDKEFLAIYESLKIKDITIQRLLNSQRIDQVVYSFISWYSLKFNSFPYFILPSFAKHDIIFSEIAKNPLG